jgi:integrase
MASKLLSATFVERCTKVGRYSDGANLFLRVRRGKRGIAKNWLIRWKPRGQGALWSKEMFLGGYPTFSLAEARERARKLAQVIHDGGDPAADQRARVAAQAIEQAKVEAEAAKAVTFEEAAMRFLADNEHDAEWLRSLKLHVFPALGSMLVSTIELAHVADLLRPIWKTRHVTAKRVRGRIQAVLDWCRVQGLTEGQNVARWKGNLDKIFASSKSKAGKALAKVEHHAALPYFQAPSVLAKLRTVDGIAARALEALALTGVRCGELTGMDWSEVDLGAKLWVIPETRTKTGIEHKVPLSTRVVEILMERGPQASGLVFPGERSSAPMRAQVLARVLKPLAGDAAVTVHGWRSTFRVFAAERTAFAHEVCEAALGHVIGNKVSRAYSRTDHLEARIGLMRMWCDYCMSPPADDEKGDDGKVVPIRRSA